ncbi:MAG TPA: S8 family peptidase, partial [bacterium]|nr:S8 family peptidase [bacterium]
QAEPDWMYYKALVPNDRFYRQQYHLPRIRCEQAWNIGTGDPSVIIGIVDSGTYTEHEDLKDRLWVNLGEIPNNGVDDDGNGYIDDINGWDFINDNNDVNPDPDGEDDNDDDIPDDNVEHGTHVAGIAAAMTNNNIGVAGVSWQSQIMTAQVFPDDGATSTSYVLQGIIYVADNGANIVNLSLGGPYSSAFNRIFQDLHSRNIVIVCAAGNEYANLDITPVSPVCNDGKPDANWVIGVAATNSQDVKVGFSNYSAKFVDVAAPGLSILSTLPLFYQYGFYDEYGSMSGTSMASPVVAGAAAVILGASPGISNSEMLGRISYFADNIDSLNPTFAGQLGGGRLNLFSVLQTLDLPLPVIPTPTPVPHRYPEKDLVMPSSEPIAFIGMDLHYPSGAARLQQITVRFRNRLESTGTLSLDDLAPLTLDELSGLTLYRDTGGPTRGGFDWNPLGSGGSVDLLVPLRSISWRNLEGENGFEVILDIDQDPPLYKDASVIPAASDSGLFDFFVVVKTSEKLAHDDAFKVDIPAGGIKALDKSVSGRPVALEYYDEDYPPEGETKVTYGEVVKFVNFTQIESSEGEYQPIVQLSPPTAVLGINGWGHRIHNYSIAEVTVDLLNIKNFSPDMLNPLSRNQTTSGVALYRDMPGTTDGVFDGVEREQFVVLENIRWEMASEEIGAASWRIVLTPETPQPLPEDDTSLGNVGADYFLVIRTSDRCRDGDSFRMEISQCDKSLPGANWRPMAGRVTLVSGDQGDLRTRRILTNTSEAQYGERVHSIKARPRPFFAFHDTIVNTQIGVESRTTPVLGIDMHDYGADCGVVADREHWGWILQEMTFDVISTNPNVPVRPEHFRPVLSNGARDGVFADYSTGIGIFMDDDTETGDGLDDDEIFFNPRATLRDEELRNNMDDDDDGLIDEDCGDGDPPGIVNGAWDTDDDIIFFGARNYTADSTFANPPIVQTLAAEPGFRVTFNFIMQRSCETHNCYAPGWSTADIVSEEPLGSNFYRLAEWPVVSETAVQCGDEGCDFSRVVYYPTGMGFYPIGQPCPDLNPPCGTRVARYQHYIQIPNDNEGVLLGDDMFVTIRTHHLVPNGLEFAFRVNSGAFSYTKYSSVGNENKYPGSSEGFLLTKPIRVVVDVFNELVDMTLQDQRIEQFSASDRVPVTAVGLNMDIWEHSESSPEAYEAEFSYEYIHEFLVELVDEGGFQLSIDPTASDLLPLSGTAYSGIGLYFDDGITPGSLDPQDSMIELVRTTAEDVQKVGNSYRVMLRPRSRD